MFLLIDLLIILIIAVCIITSAKRGFVRVLIEVAGFIAAALLTFTISTPLSEVTYDKMIEPAIIESATEKSAENAEQLINNTWQALPDFIKVMADNENLSADSLSESINANLNSKTEEAVKSVSREIIKPVVTELLSLVYSLIIMAVLTIIVSILAKSLNKLFSFKFVGKINKFLGGSVGAVKGAFFACIFVLCVCLLISFSNKGFWIFTPENLEKTYLFKLILKVIPFNIL